MQVFLDANVLFSAADPDSVTCQLLQRVQTVASVVSSPHAIEEARRNIGAKRPQFQAAFELMLKQIDVTFAFAPDLESDLPEHDEPILAAAVGSLSRRA